MVNRVWIAILKP